MASGSSGAETSGSDLAASLDEDDPLIGQVIDGRYRIEAVLGTGGVGVVYRAEHTALQRPVAIKVLHGHFGDNADLKRRFQREGQALSALQHPNVVAITDYGIATDTPYLTMELLEGRTLADLLDDEGAIEPERGLEIARSVLRGLAFAHARGILHRDLKPANVFLQSLPDDPDHVKLLDFGLAKIVSDETEDGEPTLTGMGTILGTPTYMSPEQAAGSRADMRSDVYTAGVVLFEVLCGRPPFVGATRPEVMRAHMVEAVPRLAEARPGFEPTPELQALLDRALAKEPGERFDDGGEMLAALDELPKPAATLSEQARSGTVPRAPEDVSEQDTVASAPSSGAGAHRRESHRPGKRRALPVLVGGGALALGAAVAITVAIAGGGDGASPEAAADGQPGGAAAAAPPGSEPALAEGSPIDDPWEGPGPEDEADDDPEAGAAGETEADGTGDGAESAESEGEDETSAQAEEGDEPGEAGGDDTGGDDEAETADEGAGVQTVRPQPRAKDPFEGRRLRGMLRIYKAGVDRGRDLSRRHQRRLREYQRNHPEDPRASLILARDFFNREWYNDALERYETAWQIDPSVRGDKRMLRDLVRMAATEVYEREAGDALIRIYGEESFELMDPMIRTAPSADARRRLERLRERIVAADGTDPTVGDEGDEGGGAEGVEGNVVQGASGGETGGASGGGGEL